MPLLGNLYENGQALRVCLTPADLGGGGAEGQVALTLDPLGIYAWTQAGGWEPLASLEGASLPAVGNHNLYSTTHPDVAGTRDDGDVLVWRPGSGFYDHEQATGLIAAATEALAGKVELATAAETQAGTDTARAVHPAGLMSTLTPEAPITPTLTNSWVAYGSPYLTPGYYKDAGGWVYLQGTVKNGGLNTTNPILTLPAGYRPSADMSFSVDGSGFDPWRNRPIGWEGFLSLRRGQRPPLVQRCLRQGGLMRTVSRIDAAGVFIADVRIEDDAPLPAGCVESRPPEGLYSPSASSERVVCDGL